MEMAQIELSRYLECIQLDKFDVNILGKTKWTLTGEVSKM